MSQAAKITAMAVEAGARASIRQRTVLALLLMTVPFPAFAGNRWQEAGSGAVAILPAPLKSATVTGGSFVCAEQRWSFRLRLDASVAAAVGERDGTIAIDGAAFPIKARFDPGFLTVAAPFETIDPLKAGDRLSFVFDGETTAVFSLRDSRNTLEAVAPRCSPVDMSGHESIVLSETDDALEMAALLMAEEAALFREATGKQPVISAAKRDVAQDAEILFASLCGSTRYYGQSGCTMSGFVRQGAGGDWRKIYNSEGMALYMNPKTSNDGWPDLVTLGLSGGEPSRWRWTGLAYEIREPVFAEDGELRGPIQ